MSQTDEPQSYVVVARRYRPQGFGELVGQQQVSQALVNAISTGRVGHAYLFTGARGVGKTSTARILARCLNCVEGPTPQPCGVCDNCVSISTGEDVDVLEIDGASNRGIDEIRQLRSNVNIRPSRSRFKVYIIDEVHMLTAPAFNALLKTLEEPPEHVKFIFCTTDPEKIPITVVSRCQRFDFAGISVEAIVARLRQIVEAEDATADDEVLQLLARRAAGSMRDSQSLLEQLLAFGGDHLSAADVHQLLGTARSGTINNLVQACLARDAARALTDVNTALVEGVDPSQLVEQLLGAFRDMMAAAVGCQADAMLSTTSEEYESLREAAKQLGLETILAAMQILDQALVRMRQSTQVRAIAEAAIVRLCHLDQLDDLAALIQQVQSAGDGASGAGPPRGGTARRTVEKKTNHSAAGERVARSDRAHPSPATSGSGPPHAAVAANASQGVAAAGPAPTIPLQAENVDLIWQRVLGQLEGLTASNAARCTSVAISGPKRLVIQFPASYTSSRSYCDRPQQRQELEQALQNVVGEAIRVEFDEVSDAAARPAAKKTQKPQAQLRKQVMNDPVVQAAAELFDGVVIGVESKGRAVDLSDQ